MAQYITHQRWESIHSFISSREGNSAELILARGMINDLVGAYVDSVDRYLRDMDMCEEKGWKIFNGEYAQEVRERMAALKEKIKFLNQLGGKKR